MTDTTDVDPAPRATLVLFGAMGDLTKRLLIPAMINLTRAGLLGDDFHVIGVGIDDADDDRLRQRLGEVDTNASDEGATPHGEAWDRLAQRVTYLRGDFTQDAIYEAIGKAIGAGGDGNVAFYLAVQPSFFGAIVDKLADHGLTTEREGAFRRVAIEKPFGSDLASAQALNQRILARLDERQIYRVDHFLGKETVQNIMTTRFANILFDRVWNADCIDSVQITAAETVDVGTRGKFYDATGALRDMVPNHLFTLLAMVAMEPPATLEGDAVRDAKAAVLTAIRRWSVAEASDNAVRGAYRAGTCAGKTVPAYRDVPDVAVDSRTETYVALKLMIDNDRWRGVPFYLRTGKVMTAAETEIVIQFKQAVSPLVANCDGGEPAPANRLILRLHPDEGLDTDILIKCPGMAAKVVPATLAFRYAGRFDIAGLDGYESLLYDLLTGNQTLFQRADAIEAGWAAVQPFLDAWRTGDPEPYDPGSDGPEAASALIARDGRAWDALNTAGA